MTERVLFVDDEPTLLKIYAKALPDRLEVHTAESGSEALRMVKESGPFAVVVSDKQMPGMDGIELLENLKDSAPGTVRMMLTGESDQSVAMQAVNQGEIFRFLSKPPSRQQLIDSVDAAVSQYHLIHAEQELLERTLKGSVEALAHVLSLSDPRIFGRTTKTQALVKAVVAKLSIDDDWAIETAGLLSQLGCITLPDSIIEKVFGNQLLTDDESAVYVRYPAASAELISKIPRMEAVEEIVRYQLKDFGGGGWPTDDVKGDKIPLGARILRILHDYVRFESITGSPEAALARMTKESDRYDDAVLSVAADVIRSDLSATSSSVEQVRVSDLEVGMKITHDVLNVAGMVLVCQGQVVTDTMRDRLRNFAASKAIDDVISVER